MPENCPNAEACPVFNNILKDKVMTAKFFRMLFCEAGESSFTNCKRFQMKQKYGKVPPNLLPNSIKPIEKIAKEAGLI
ncbi:MAG TPA: hypothetical protein PLI27_01045 [Ignavibacteriales bacterium]|nr:hypothetical protein [Ignavibacteriales bacterium]HOL80275.1 hypothetical protein [Ignavibacteriales bacterium]HOM64554.1 hypothetical protein [Ignavibacteriales bacterium]HPD66651.1 hypothetical protein [Ignavibacteriales bacterium]HPP32464.1 hypothetical protein [Ignavibacteriales bacterium]